MKRYVLISCLGALVWLFATLFFVFFGERVLFSPGSASFFISLSLLISGTALLLWMITFLYSLFDQSKNAALTFGLIGTIVGLTFDAFSLANHHYVFPHLSDSKIIAFTVWMSFAYALYLIIPAVLNEWKKKAALI
ncbi:DUF5367 family protein [Pseudobacillus wudalianchiensis]|uniref:DUF5367 domain-containing protein n=1 Tax=Pseudobacillus wudalianchiensis TaxID=1743143 RepID=A0A1B9AFZ1_9BACI|nr:DUF5367 family protein [Bacillus wudalianchiensis]OCA82752.1 hypothetical protein A8F95_13470 [Bacillus wudalianchiensis]